MEKETLVGLARNDVPPETKRVLQIRKVEARESFIVAICSSHWVGFPTHYNGKRTIPHQSNKRECPGCKGHCKLDWHGYLHCCNPEGKCNFVLEITSPGAKLLDELRGDRPSLRGMVVSVRRQNNTKKSPLVFELCGDVSPRVTLPKPYNVIETLSVLWGIKDLA